MRVAPPAAGDEPALRRARNMAQGGDDGLHRELRQGRRAVLIRERFDALGAGMEILPVEGFRRRAVEERDCCMNAATSFASAVPEAASCPFSSKLRPRRRRTKSSSSALAGPVSKAITVSPSI